MGVGAAIRTGIYYADAHGFDVVVVAASDDQDVPAEIPRLLQPIDEGTAEFLCREPLPPWWAASASSAQPDHHDVVVLGDVFSLALRPVTDGTNGFRAFRTKTALSFPLDQEWLNHYELEPYLFIYVSAAGSGPGV